MIQYCWALHWSSSSSYNRWMNENETDSKWNIFSISRGWSQTRSKLYLIGTMSDEESTVDLSYWFICFKSCFLVETNNNGYVVCDSILPALFERWRTSDVLWMSTILLFETSAWTSTTIDSTGGWDWFWSWSITTESTWQQQWPTTSFDCSCRSMRGEIHWENQKSCQRSSTRIESIHRSINEDHRRIITSYRWRTMRESTTPSIYRNRSGQMGTSTGTIERSAGKYTLIEINHDEDETSSTHLPLIQLGMIQENIGK